MRRLFRITGFLYLALLTSLIISGGHIDHNGIGQHLCFERCQPAECEESSGQTCFDESLLEHISENSNNIKTISSSDSAIVFIYLINVNLTPKSVFAYLLKTDIFSQSANTWHFQQNRAPPFV